MKNSKKLVQILSIDLGKSIDLVYFPCQIFCYFWGFLSSSSLLSEYAIFCGFPQ